MTPNPDEPGARVLAEHVGFEIVDADGQVWFFDRRLRGPVIAAAVSGGVGAIALINTIVFTAMLAGDASLASTWVPVVVLAGLVVVGFGICRFSLRLRRRRLEAPRAQLQRLARLDRQTGTVYDADGRPLGPASQVAARRGMLIGSSAPAVVLAPPKHGRIVVFHGSLIGGGVDQVLQLLTKLGFAR